MKVEVLSEHTTKMGGKTRICLTKYLPLTTEPDLRVAIFRQTAPQIFSPGGMRDESFQIYPHFNGTYKSQQKKWVFPKGGSITFAAIGDERDLPGWQGSQLTHILIDEAAEWPEASIMFLLSRLRSGTFKGKMQCVLSCNPNKESFLFDWVKPFLDEDGIPKDGTENIIKWFVVLNGKMLWGDSAEQLYSDHGSGYTLGKDFIPKSFRFIPMGLYDNPILLKNNPDYLASLLAQSKVNQKRFLHGSWTAIVEGANYFKREWTPVVDRLPEGKYEEVRSWDLASSPVSAANKNPDWTAGVKIVRSTTGHYYVVDAYRFRKSTSEVIDEIVKTAKADGIDDCLVTVPKDPGAAGAQFTSYLIRTLAENGIPAKSVQMSGHSSKLKRFLPFASLCESGNVSVVRGDWNEDWWDELENFTGGVRNLKDDMCDATSDGFNTLAKRSRLPIFSLPDMSRPSPTPIQPTNGYNFMQSSSPFSVNG